MHIQITTMPPSVHVVAKISSRIAMHMVEQEAFFFFFFLGGGVYSWFFSLCVSDGEGKNKRGACGHKPKRLLCVCDFIYPSLATFVSKFTLMCSFSYLAMVSAMAIQKVKINSSFAVAAML